MHNMAMDNSKKTIIAIGGGGFTHEPENPLLDQYVLSQSSKENPKICLLPTANSNPELYTTYFEKSFSRFNCQPSSLSLFAPHTADIEDFLLSQDIIYVGGGNTKSMLALWKEWGVDKILRKAWEQNIILAGVSAGAICWFEEGVSASVPGQISFLNGLGFLPGICCPHYDTDLTRKNTVQARIKKDITKTYYLIDDNVLVHFQEGSFVRAISSSSDKKAIIVNNGIASALQVSAMPKSSGFSQCRPGSLKF